MTMQLSNHIVTFPLIELNYYYHQFHDQAVYAYKFIILVLDYTLAINGLTSIKFTLDKFNSTFEACGHCFYKTNLLTQYELYAA